MKGSSGKFKVHEVKCQAEILNKLFKENKMECLLQTSVVNMCVKNRKKN